MVQPLRYELHAKLVQLLGAKHVYFQPPPTVQMTYPCIVYELDKYHDAYANDSLYSHKTRYQVTVIDRNPDSELPLKLNEFPYTSLESSFAYEGLNHFVFTLYY